MPRSSNIVLMGPAGAGKSTLMQALKGSDVNGIRKTQTIEFHGSFVDTPGEYLHLPHFHHVLVSEANRAHAVLLVQDATSEMLQLPPGFVRSFRRPVMGAITKIDRPEARVSRARKWMEIAGVAPQSVFAVSGLKGQGLDLLRKALEAASWDTPPETG